MSIEVNTAAAEPTTEIYTDRDAVTAAVAEKLLRVLRETVAAEGSAHIALTGGGPGIGTLASTAELLKNEPSLAPDWTKVHMWWGDERMLPDSDPDRNVTQACEALLDWLSAECGLPQENVHPMPTSEDAAIPEAGAEMYAEELRQFASLPAQKASGVPGNPQDSSGGERRGLEIPRLAVHLMGVGPDGHVNSLFPGKDSLQVSGVPTVGEDEAPAELGPPLRVTLTFDAVHTAQRVWLVTAGQDKAEAVGRAFKPGTTVEEIPATNARGEQETIWHLDEAAAHNL